MTSDPGPAIDRRKLLKMALATLWGLTVVRPAPAEVFREVSKLKPGEFTWHPERQPYGPVAVVVSLPEQRVHVYRNGIRIAVSTCSTGKPGHDTPFGVFVVLQKDKNHKSSTYDDAPMPNMNRLTWSGIALHAGNLPGYPASHGCVRLPFAFSEKLFGITHLGTPVIISGAHSDPVELVHPGMVLGAYEAAEFKSVEKSLAGKKQPPDWADASQQVVTSVIVSSADRKIMLVENSTVRAEGTATIKGAGKLGSHVYILKPDDARGGSLAWTALSHAPDANGLGIPHKDSMMRVSADNGFIRKMQEAMHPGMVMIFTDAPLSPDSRTGKDFVIMS